VHVYAEEMRALESPIDNAERTRYRGIQFAHGPQWTSYADLGEKWFGFDAVRELKGLPPEILLIPLAGHTRGHAGIAINTGEKWLLHAGDAYFFHGEIDPFHPHCPPGLAFFESRVQTVAGPRVVNQQRLRELVRDTDVTVFSAHDPAELHPISS
jgi:glyoxylase-like metal-dependent hydrolase (beta-lactamase superfamily II)